MMPSRSSSVQSTSQSARDLNFLAGLPSRRAKYPNLLSLLYLLSHYQLRFSLCIIFSSVVGTFLIFAES
jgi:hypothetical protein